MINEIPRKTYFVSMKEENMKFLSICEDVDMTTERTDFAIPFSEVKQLSLIQELNFSAEKS